MRWFGLLLTTVVLGAGGLFLGQDLLDLGQVARPKSAQATVPETSPHELDDHQGRRIFASGVVEGTQRDVPLRFELAGRLQTIHVREGDEVARGDVLAELDAQAWEQRVAEADARLKLARAERVRMVNGAREEAREVLRADVKTYEVQVREAEALVGRGEDLNKKKSISKQELDDYRFKKEKAEALLASARAKLAEIDAPAREDDLSIADAKISLAEANLRHERSLLEKTRLRAPTDGIILHVLIETGELVGPEDDRSLITMTNRERTRVRAYIEELDALTVVAGQPVEVTADGRPGAVFQGTVLTCSPFVRGKSQRHHKPGELVDLKVREVVIELRDGNDLIVGLPVDVFIVSPESVPEEAAPSKSPQDAAAAAAAASERVGDRGP